MSRRRRLHLVLFVAMLLLAGLPALAPRPVAAAGTADLAVTLVASKRNLPYGHTMTLTATVTNLGPDAATGVAIGIGVSDSYANFGGTCPDGKVSDRCELGTLAPGASVTLHFQVMACCSCCPEGVGVAVASVFHDADTVDPDPDNNFVRSETRLVGKAPF